MKHTINPVVKFYLIGICCILITVPQLSCKKYLDKKSSQQLAIPSTLAELQALLDNQKANNYTAAAMAEVVADNYYLTASAWSGLTADTRKNHTWDADAKTLVENGFWTNPYYLVYQSNFILEILPTIQFDQSQRAAYDNIKGTALFHRAHAFYSVAQVYCRPYSASAATDPGIVLRMTSDVEAPVSRSTVKETYDQVINDLKTAADLLPATVTVSMRPGKAAAYGMLSRVYLSMREYTEADIYATKALQLSNTLLDYNALTLSGNSFFPANNLTNPEILFISKTSSTVFNGAAGAITDSTLYRSYDADDLRQTIFYSISNNNAYWRGSYSAGLDGNGIFDGICTDELYLNRAECRARANNVSGAMDDLNALLVKRWRTGTFTLVTATDATDALNKILVERRKELAFRGLRWTDLRRLNLEGANITLKRVLNNTTYTLPPNDLRWVLLIPEVEINRSGIPQNPR